MALITQGSFLSSCLLFFSCLLALSEASTTPKPIPYSQPFNRTSFPGGFVFGAGTAAYQSEGAALIDGRGPSVWDIFTRKHPEKIFDGSTGDVTNDVYHRYKEDIQLMKKIGLDSFRFSISWSRIFPNGKLSEGANPLGVKFYNDYINELLANGIKPLVTLWHYDAPQALEDEYKTWLSPKILKDYLDYVDFCFKTFGDRVKLWVTFNEPNAYSWNAYDRGTFAPGRCSSYVGKCPAGNSATEPYIAAHHFLLSHAAAVKLYRQKYQPHQKGKIGITIPTHWFVPKFDTEASRKAASRALDFLFGWFMDPVIFGDYPQSMRSIVGRRLPKFSEEQKKQLKGSIDFLGLNYYTGLYAESAPSSNDPNKSYSKDNQATTTTYKNGIPIGTPTALDWLFVYPKGIGEILLHIKEKYNNPDIYITENGVADANNKSLPIKEALKDNLRIGYFHDHLSYVLKAIKGGVNVKGYYLWTFWDDFEWDAGFTVRFGVTYIDYKNNLTRYFKDSAYWFQKLLKPT